MPNKVKEVECDLNDFDDWDLKDELESRGYRIDPELDDFEDWEIEEEFKSRKLGHDVNDSIFALYQDWLADEGDNDRRFDKALRAFFSKHLDKNI